MKFDTLDQQLLMYLQENSKITYKELSDKLNLSSTAIHERIKKLEKAGIIEKYVALVNRRLINRELLVFSHIKLQQHSQENIRKFETEIQTLKEVQSCFHVSGDYDYIVKMSFENMDEYRNFMVNKLTTINVIGSTHSTFVIGDVKDDTAYQLL
ncbi:Lrp/AsnC family transcriptional regulator, leucine-responsive regulatory protein [Algoriella xinjiangensis]|uniref:Lrp/AsnC family transcriptional regulator, leucine-responsive regulatory protein n=1 Tax=Algoriella xinjiangensis TaxID=684065 RepID=A0A1I4XYH0_9FLAO|nr:MULTISPECIES: Lrp/AsnC family transcriptional regulator [Algoriella]MBO6213868.1 Lrp/AsnC family transcriptional regulator [Algoriella sp.]SFN30845.1 Lrp/AsnC family transcriptional regulator, leucine-responsive regulatory protein [Algoriella xinjiangensis]VDH15389.1 Leucine-responsive regulatory protein [Algoriella xinjiangensis]